jgi:hypothetical protein
MAGASTGGSASAGAPGSGAEPCTAVDDDADGVEAHRGGCLVISIPGDPPSDDCNDADASLAVAAYVDADGDGAGDPERLACLPAGEFPAGYAPRGTDCDDTSADISPFATELAGDGIDQDCDGSDGFADCLFYPSCGCDAGGELAPEDPCEGFDLAVVSFELCESGGCGREQIQLVQVANLGTEAAPGEITLSSNTGSLTRIAALAAGQVTPSILWRGTPPAILRVSAATGGAPGDCNTENDVLELPSGVAPLCK